MGDKKLQSHVDRKRVIQINNWHIISLITSVNKENYVSVDSRRVVLQDRIVFIMQVCQALI